METTVAAITGIPEDVLHDYQQSKNFSVEQRLKWIGRRETSREEDMSYSLVGIFDVAMSVRYGEGAEQARKRLLKKISKASVETEGHDSREMVSVVDKDVRSQQQGRALLKACARGHNMEVLELLKLGASVDYKDHNGLTALHHASLRGKEDIGQILLGDGADINAQSIHLGTPLCVAAFHGQYKMVTFLLKNEAHLHVPGRGVGTSLHCASWNGSLAVATILLINGADSSLVCQIELELLEYGAALGSPFEETSPRKFSA